MDSGVMYALAQLQAEVERLQEAYGALKRIAGVFYDAGFDDALQRQDHKDRKDRHLKLLGAVILTGAAAAGVVHTAGMTCHDMAAEVASVASGSSVAPVIRVAG